MSSRKDKLIEEAQRFALRGQLDKAIRSYEQAVALDPSAINQRQRLAELLVKAGRTEQARGEFRAIGEFFSSNGYYLKAIAVYKKLQVMFPGDVDVTLTLADLNEKHGLTANALAEYKQVFDLYERQGEGGQALAILAKMHAVDPKNVPITLKLAETYVQAGRREEAYSLFGRLASLLQERGDGGGVVRLTARIQQLFPEKSEFMLEVLTEQVWGDEASTLNAIGGIQTLLRSNPEDRRVWELMIGAYRRLGQWERVKLAYQHCLRYFPGDRTVQRGMMECAIAEGDEAGALQLLEQYEPNFVAGSAWGELVELYQALERVAPVSLAVLQGLKRALEGAGELGQAAAVGHKIDSLSRVSRDEPQGGDAVSADGVDGWRPDSPVASTEEPPAAPEAGASPAASFPEESAASTPFDAEEIEIEIELDEGGEPFAELAGGEGDDGSVGDEWLRSVDLVFDSEPTPTRNVRFGDDVDVSDAQSHYDLGVAFREMGLLDEAINEFRQAADDPGRRLACLLLQADCLREKGNVESAEALLRSLLRPGQGVEDACSIKYELAMICGATGRTDEASRLLAEIDRDQPGFRDVRARLDSSTGESGLDFLDDELKDFDLK